MSSVNRIIVVILFLLCGITLFSQVEHLSHYRNYNWEHPKFDRITADHEIIAILPISASIAHYHSELKNVSYDGHKQMELDAGGQIQKEIYAHLLKKEEKDKLTVTVQDPDLTNSRLKHAGAEFENINEYDPVQVAMVLKVDAIVAGTYKANRPRTIGESFIDDKASIEASIKLRIYNAEDGALLAGFNKSVAGNYLSSSEQIETSLIRKAAKKIPY